MKVIDVHPRFNELCDSVKSRTLIEIKIAARVIRAVLATGNWKLHGIDLDEGLEPTPTIEEALKLIFDLDDARLFFTNTKDETHEAWVYFVLGNDGWDVVSDYTCSSDGFEQAVESASNLDEDAANTEV